MTYAQILNQITENKNLSFEQCQGIFRQIFAGELDEAQIAAWITAMKMKGETAEELAACISVMRDGMVKVNCQDKKAIDIVGTGGDGFSTYNISTAAAIITAGAGVTVAKHGNRAFSSKSGSADVLSVSGVNNSCSKETVEACISEIGLGFLFAPGYHPAVKHSVAPRRSIGIRTLFNLIGPMCNPAGVQRASIGVYSEKYCRLLAHAAAQSGAEHMLFVHGRDGMDEVSIAAPTLVCEVRGTEVNEYEISPKSFDSKLDFLPIESIKGGSPEENSQALKRLLSGEENAYMQAACMNAATAIYASGFASDLVEAFYLSRESLLQGKALEKFQQLIEKTNEQGDCT